MSGAPASWRWVGSSSRERTVSRDYVGRITSIVDNGPSPGNTISYTYDGDGDLLSETASGSGTSWLLSATWQSFPHSRTYTEEADHDVLKSWVDDGAAESLIYWGSLRRDRESAAGLTFYYDYYSATPERLSSKTALNVDDSREVMLAYDGAGRITTLDWAPFSSVDVGLIYGGPLGHLTGRSVTGTGNYAYLYDHDMRLAEEIYPVGTRRRVRYAGGREPMVDDLLPASGSKKSWEHIYLGGEPVAQVATDSSGSALRLLITDRMGRVRKLTNTSGTSLVRYIWDAWGDSNGPYAATDTTENPMPEYAWGLPGQRGVGNGVTLNGWRAYVPEIGQYTSPEPLHAMTAAAFVGPQAYSYAAARPLMYSDPDGRQLYFEPLPLAPSPVTNPLPWLPNVPAMPPGVPAPALPGGGWEYPDCDPMFDRTCKPVPVEPRGWGEAEGDDAVPVPGERPLGDDTCKNCPPCPPPPPPRIDRVPPSRPHKPCPGDHMHTFVMNQLPNCECRVGKGSVICL